LNELFIDFWAVKDVLVFANMALKPELL